MAPVTVSQLWVYPVKSCAGIPLQAGVVTPTGLLFDRNWVIVKEANGRFLTQRQMPKLALVEVAVVPEQLLAGADIAGCPDAKLVLRAPGMPELQVPLTATAEGKPLVQATVWEWSGLAADEGEAPAQWLSAYLGFPACLLRFAGQVGGAGSPADDPQRRQVDPEWTPAGRAYETAFPDGFPFLLANESSLAELNRQMEYKGGEALPMNRFRPNLVVAGARAFAEDTWRQLCIAGGRSGGGSAGNGGAAGGVEFENVKPCSRCKVTTINQATAEEGDEPLITLAEQRSGRALGWEGPAGFRGSVFFATNLVALQTGVVRVGDAVAVTATRDGPPLPYSTA